MRPDVLRRRLAEALSGDGTEVYPDYPASAKRVSGEPFATLALDSLELRAIGFGRSTVRRGTLKFRLSAYAGDGDSATATLHTLAGRCESDEVRALLGEVSYTARGLRDAKAGLCAADAELCASVLVAVGEEREADVLVLNLRGRVSENIGE